MSLCKLKKLLAEQVNPGSIPALPKCCFSPRIFGGTKKSENLSTLAVLPGLITGLYRYRMEAKILAEQTLSLTLGRGCGAVGRAVAYDTRDPRFKS